MVKIFVDMRPSERFVGADRYVGNLCVDSVYRSRIRQVIADLMRSRYFSGIYSQARTDYLLDRQLQSLEQSFLKQGGPRESMTRARLNHRKNQRDQ
jgi:four helix bundle suffix protein